MSRLTFPMYSKNSCKMKLMVGVCNFDLSMKLEHQYQEVNIEQSQV